MTLDVRRLVLLLLAFATHAAAAGGRLIVEESTVKVVIRGREHGLQALIVKPADRAGRLPIAVIAHGSPRDRAERPRYRVRALLPQARDLAHRGWLVVAFLRRGFGESDGPFAEGFDCAAPNYRRALATAAEDIEAVRAAIARRPDADPERVLGIGVSAGGAAMLAWSSTRPAGLVAVVNVSGGTGSLTPRRNCDEDALVATLASYGRLAKVPTLWLYGDNDSFFGPELVRRMHAAFTLAGGDATLDPVGPVGKEGHQLFSRYEGRLLWLAALDRFLRGRHLPTWEPGPIESAGGRLKPEARKLLARYLNAPTEKAFAVSQRKGLARYWSGAGDIDTAREKSRELCERNASESCAVLVENFAVPAAPHLKR